MSYLLLMPCLGRKRGILLLASIISLVFFFYLLTHSEVTMAGFPEIHPCTYEDEAPDSPIPLHMPFHAGQVWYPGGDGSFYGDGEHTDANNDYYATDWNKGTNLENREPDEGEDVLPVADGTIAEVGDDQWLGYYVKIDHGSGIQTTYAHLQARPGWSQGQPIKRWEVVGKVGDTGNAYGTHLHLSFKKDGFSKKVLGSPKPSPMLTQHGWKKLCDNAQNGPYISANGPSETDNVSVALIIDATGSMRENDPQGMRKAAAKVFIDTTLLGDKIAVVSFDTQAHHLAPLRTIISPTDRVELKTAVDQVGSSGWTDLNVGLQGGFNELLSDTTSDNKKAAVFLTDGKQEGSGPYDPQSHLQYRDRGWPVYTVGLGSSADMALLKQIATDTGGECVEDCTQLTDPNQLQALYFEISHKIAGGNLILNTSVTMTQGSSQQLAVGLPPDQSTATFFIGWSGSEVTLSLTSPSGRQIDPSITDPDVYHAKGLTYEIYTIQYPEAGQWVMALHGTSLPTGGEEVDVRVAVRGPRFVYLPVVFRNYSLSTQPTPPTNTPTCTPTATNTPIPTDTPTPTPTVEILNFKVSFQARDNADNKPQNVPIKVEIKNLSGDQTLFEATDWVWVTPAGSSYNWGTASVDVSSAGLVSGQSYQVFVKGAMHLAKRVTIPLTDGLTIDYTDLALNPDGVLWACDVNQDNQVSNTDVSIVLSHYGTAPTDPDPSSEVYRSDQNGDGVVNSFDHTICLTNLGKVGD